ncbi:hypothetical protein AB3S75_000603 [Citrus x aurantiifolia]
MPNTHLPNLLPLSITKSLTLSVPCGFAAAAAADSLWLRCRCRFLLALLPPSNNCLCFLLAARSSSHRCFLQVHCCCRFLLALLWSLQLPLPSRLLTLCGHWSPSSLSSALRIAACRIQLRTTRTTMLKRNCAT